MPLESKVALFTAHMQTLRDADLGLMQDAFNEVADTARASALKSLASAMKKILPYALRKEILSYADPLAEFLEFLTKE